MSQGFKRRIFNPSECQKCKTAISAFEIDTSFYSYRYFSSFSSTSFFLWRSQAAAFYMRTTILTFKKSDFGFVGIIFLGKRRKLLLIVTNLDIQFHNALKLPVSLQQKFLLGDDFPKNQYFEPCVLKAIRSLFRHTHWNFEGQFFRFLLSIQNFSLTAEKISTLLSVSYNSAELWLHIYHN